MSLIGSRVHVMLPVKDPAVARKYYSERLGLKDDGTNAEGSGLIDAGGAEIVLRQMPRGAQSDHTAVSFEVDDLEAVIEELEGRGVRFEDYDTPQLRTVDHIYTGEGERAAWFLDPDGNVLCVHEVTG